jgi:hypothetical protein
MTWSCIRCGHAECASTFLECYLICSLFALRYSLSAAARHTVQSPPMTRTSSYSNYGTVQRREQKRDAMQPSQHCRAERWMQKTGIAATPEETTTIPNTTIGQPRQASQSTSNCPRPIAATSHIHLHLHPDPPLCVAGARTRAYRSRRGRVVVATCAFLRPVPGSDVPCENHRYQPNAPSLSARVRPTTPKRVFLWQAHAIEDKTLSTRSFK